MNSSHSILLSLFVLIVAGLNSAALAQSANSSQPVHLDLGSERATIQHAGSDAVIDSGSGKMSVKSGVLLTPAQYAALTQVLSGSNQSLKLDGAGKAVGGTFSLAAMPQTQIGSLVVPANVTVMGAQTASSLSLMGGLINSGTLLAIPQHNASTFQLTAAFIQNNPCALISSIQAGSGSAINLAINTIGNLVNLGSITSGGALSINAGGSIVNGIAGQSSPALMSGLLGTNLTSALGSIINSGVISSQLGNVSINTTVAKDLSINNALGSILANMGSVNIANLSESVKGGIDLNGGLIEAASICFSSNDGVVDAFLDEMRGPVDINAGAAHFAVNGGNLLLRNIALSGDPSFVNMAGDLTLNPNLLSVLSFPGQDLAVLASGDVIAGAGLTMIDLSSANGGGNLFISAGLSVSPVAGGFSLGAPSASGGSVRLQNINVNTSASTTDARAGDVNIIAHDDNTINEGTFALNDKGFVQIGSIDASSADGFGGSVSIIAHSDDLVLSAPITTNGRAGFEGKMSGRISLNTGEPVSNNLTFLSSGTISSGSFGVDFNSVTHELNAIVVGAGVLSSANEFGPGGQDLNATNVIPGFVLSAWGNANFADNSVVSSYNALIVESRGASLDLGNGSSFSAVIGSLGMQSQLNLGLNTNTQLTARDGLVLTSMVGSIIGGGGHTINCQWGSISITAAGSDIVLGNAGTNTMTSMGGQFLFAANDISLPGVNQFRSAVDKPASAASNSNIEIFAGNTINIGSGDLFAGNLAGATHAGVYGPASIESPAAIIIHSQGNLQNGANLHSVGSEILLSSLNGNIQLSSGSTYNAIGGNIFLLAGGSISGGNNTFSTQAAGENGRFSGGNIEVVAGFPYTPIPFSVSASNTDANFQNAADIVTGIIDDEVNVKGFLRIFPDPHYSGPALDANGMVSDPSILGANVLVSNTGGDFGRIRSTTAGGSVNLAGSQIALNKGSLFFDALAAGSTIDLQNSQFNTSSFKVVPDGGLPLADSKSDRFISGVKAFNISFELPDIFSDVSNINVPSERQLLNTILNEDNRDQQGNQSILAGMGLLNNGVFELGGFRGFDTGRIDGPSGSGGGVASQASGGGSVQVLNMAGGPGGSAAPVQALGIMNDTGAKISPVRVSEQRSDLVLFTTAGQVLTGNPGGSNGATAIGACGTTVSEDKGALLLHAGKLYANSGATSMKVVTQFGTIVLQPDTSAAIEVRADGSGRIVVLSSKNKSEAATLEHGGELLSLAAGEQMRFEPEDAEPANASAPNRGVLVKEQVPVNSLIEKENEGFYANRSIKLSGNASGAYQRMLERINKYVESSEAEQAGRGALNAAGRMQSAPTLGSANSKAKTNSRLAGEPAHILAAAGTIYQQEGEGVLSIKIGSIFIKPEMEQVVKTALAELKVDAGAGAEVQVKNGQVRFRSYSGPGKVRVMVANKSLLLAPGQELVLQTQKPTKEEALPQDGIARRSLSNFELPNGTYGVAGDFSILSAMQAAPHLRPVRVAVKRENIDLRANMLKTAASLSIVRAAQGRYFMASTHKSQLPEGVFSDKDHMLESRVSYADK